ncbi:glycosyltransferase family 39 protein [Lyngbya sp. PCC 8106]|uniref:ArnT family glycosyltransferase n=1 Tax=Lyngbya sp. (strain PCC 8106) TaxID=313612 RepID=UPI0000EAD5CA|nr:glycosyltransferase family 39 protein [Lyngbya sp. PCC 8106]EAW37656.1 Glycosyl transferase, family 39 [Lyngbya sp. PCC 8106]
MSHQIFATGKPRNQTPDHQEWTDSLWIFGLFIAALLLFGLNLGGVALRDWDEGTVAQVAREIAQGDLHWLYPTLHGSPYFNKPPLVHNLMAIVYHFAGIHEWTARFPSALLTAASVPLLYVVGLELFRQRTAAVCSALVYLTLLPVVRHGRLAMLDGTVLFLLIMMFGCVLRSRRDLRYALGSGLAFGLLCLTKGIFLALLLGAIALIFLAWDTPRLLQCKYLWLGLLLGLFPVAIWYSAQWLKYDQEFFQINLGSQSWRRIWESVENNQGAPWYYLLEILKYAWPWQLFWIPGLIFTWKNRNFSWAKLILVWTGVYFVSISLMTTKLPWYILPIYPALALAVGGYFAQVWREGDRETGQWQGNDRQLEDLPEPLPHKFIPIFALLSFVGCLGCLYFADLIPAFPVAEQEIDLPLTLASLSLTFALTALLLYRKDRQFLIILFWGMYVSLILFVSSNNWVWELAEDYPVKPVAALVQQRTSADDSIYTSHPYSRPSLNFYSDRKIRAVGDEELKQKWQSPHAYLLLDAASLKRLQLDQVKSLGTVSGWTLITKNKTQTTQNSCCENLVQKSTI